MPKFPEFSKRLQTITGSVFERYRAKMAAQGENLIKLHIGDTQLGPPYSLPIASTFFAEHPDIHQYCNTFGIEALRAALVEKLREDNKLEVNLEHILITSGATNALSISTMSLLEPGEDVLMLTPAWPFFFGMVKLADANLIEAPFYTLLFDNPDLDIRSYLSRFITPKTVLLYLNTPNNPSGKVLSRRQLQQTADLARQHNLWVISDEAYDGLTFDNLPHISIASLPEMFERTLSVFTFSKAFMFAGLRLGYVAANPEVIKNLNKAMVHQIYSPSSLAQGMMVEPVRTRHQWLPAVRKHFQDLRDMLVQNLKIEFWKPQATYFTFFPVNKYLDGRDYWQLIGACLDAGVAVAPGDSFGKDFVEYIRLCFTGESPARLTTGIERLNRILSGQNRNF